MANLVVAMLAEFQQVERRSRRQTPKFMLEPRSKSAIVHKRYAAAKNIMTLQILKALMILGLIALLCSPVHAAELSDDPLPTVQKNIATHKAVLVDVREPGEWKDGHVEGAISLPLSSLKKEGDTSALQQQLPKDKIVYTHCVMGVRALKAARILEKLGYDVRPLKAGYEELVKAGFEKAAN